ncbi:MAG: Rne/Rng family ribonuclease [Novosphingobium sp.]
MATRMLIDARHPEETRVAVLKGNRIEEFDFESADRKQIKGNIYLAKVTRVEPSLQAAFVDFGGNRHGFLAFSEIHPDYYQIPKEDREALLAEEAAHAEEEAALLDASEDDEESETEALADDYSENDLDEDGGVTEIDTSEKDQVATIEGGHVENGFEDSDDDGENRKAANDQDEADDRGRDAYAEDGEDEESPRPRRRGRRRQGRGRSKEADELRDKRMALRRRYKIQDVIHRRQVLLVQVVKEERGNKGAALTTYLSLAGRYCVLMPNSSHGGGISRKISAAADRKRLKVIINELNLPKTMGCIVRTAGVSRTKTEIKRDFDYLARLWDEIRERTLSSAAPTLIHSDSDLIKRAIRDIYNRDIEEVVVEGEEGYKAAKQFMKLLMPSHARRVKPYADAVPLFQRYGAEDQLTAMYDPVVQLKSGGYIVINPTEALVSIDINSGRATKEHGIEATALNTNLEAAREIARQLRLRDMAGLVVIDFIDMEYGSNIRKVEKAMKEALKNDRARIQVGRISSFGLMEMSRQRLRTGVLEATTRMCPHCDGTGLVRTASSAGLSALRLIEDEAAKGNGCEITLYASTEATIYLLNSKRSDLAEIESRYGVNVEVLPEGEDEGAKMRVASSGPRPSFVPEFAPIIEEDFDDEIEAEDEEEEFEASDGDSRRKRKKRRRGGRGRDRRADQQAEGQSEVEPDDESDADEEAVAASETVEDDDAPRKRRRRGGRRRRGRGRSDESNEAESSEVDSNAPVAETETEIASEPEPEPEYDAADVAAEAETVAAEPVSEEAAPVVDEKPKPRSRRKKAEKPAEEVSDTTSSDEASPAEPSEEVKPKPKRTRRKKADVEAAPESDAKAETAEGSASEETAPATPKRSRRKKAQPNGEADVQTEPVIADEKPAETTDSAPVPETVTAQEAIDPDDDSEPKRRGWWQRTFGAEPE